MLIKLYFKLLEICVLDKDQDFRFIRVYVNDDFLNDIFRHFVDYDGPDSGRFSFNAIISDVDLR